MKAYADYKASGVEWLGEVPSGWQSNKFKFVFCEKKSTQNMDLPFGAISFGKVIFKEDKANLTDELKANYQEVLNGEFLVNPLNLNYDLKSLRTALSKIDVVVSSGYIVMQLKDKNFDKKYLEYLLYIFDIFKMKNLGNGVRQTVNFSDIGNCVFFSPTLSEQQKIAQFLDTKTAQIDALITEQNRLIELLTEQRKAVISHAVTKGLNPNAPMKKSGVEWLGEVPEYWEIKRLKYIAKIFRGKFTHRPRNDPALYDGDYPFFQTGDVAQAKKHLFDFKQTLNEKGLAVSTLIPKGAILITIAANIGDVAILDIDACFPDSVAGFNPKKDVNNEFLFYVLSSMKSVFMESAIKNTQMNLNIDRVGSNKIAIPPLAEQKEIVAYIETQTAQIDALITEQKRLIERLKEYRTALISAAVTGKIDVQAV